MEGVKNDDFVGRHLIVDASTWEVLVKGRTIGELEAVNFDELG